LRTRPEVAGPEVWFRIVDLAQVAQNGAAVAPYREQRVEIALGPKGAFDIGKIGTLTRRLAANRVVRVVPPGKPAKIPKTPRVVELLRKAIEWQSLLESGTVASQADIARQEGITRARVTQVMGLQRLVPEIPVKFPLCRRTQKGACRSGRTPPRSDGNTKPRGSKPHLVNNMDDFL
jgi:hypothetical protein